MASGPRPIGGGGATALIDSDLVVNSLTADEFISAGTNISGSQIDAEVLAASNTETGNACEITPDDGITFNSATVSPAMFAAIMNGAFHPTYYHASGNWAAKTVSVAADRYTLLGPVAGALKVGDMDLSWDTQPSLDLSVAATWDTQAVIDGTVALNRAGLDWYVYACQPVSGNTPVWKVSFNSTMPDGYDADSSRKVAGGHSECCDIGTISGNSLTGYVAGDILPKSVWDLNFRANGQQEGHVYNAAKAKWEGIYFLSGTGSNTRSAFNAVISDMRNWMDMTDDLGAVGDEMFTDAQFQIAAEGSNQKTNIYGSQDPVRTGMIGTKLFTGTGLNDLAVSAAGLTANNVEIEITIDGTGTPDTFKWRKKVFGGAFGAYTENVAITGAAQVITDGVTVTIPATTGHTLNDKWNVYAMRSGYDTAGRRMVSNLGHEMMCGALWQWLDEQSFRVDSIQAHTHTVAVSGDPETPTTSGPTPADISPSWGWYGLPGDKGQLYRQGATGDIKLMAGGLWSYGSQCGSRSRLADASRWLTGSALGARGCSPSRNTRTF